jgi:hypothetical protein
LNPHSFICASASCEEVNFDLSPFKNLSGF